MKYPILLLALLINLYFTKAQNLERKNAVLEEFLLSITIPDSIDKIEIRNLPEIKSDEIKKPLVGKLSRFEYLDNLVLNYDSFKEEFHVFDLNDDNRPDIFYTGYLGGAADSYAYIFLNTGDSLRKVFEGEKGYIQYALREDLTFAGLLYHYEGAAADCPEMSYVDLLHFTGMALKTKNLIRYPNDVEIPRDYLSETIDFKVANEQYYLRSQPEIFNKDNGCNRIGNIHYTYKKGDRGTAYGIDSDYTGRKWYFVIMENRIAGWMSSRYLEEE